MTQVKAEKASLFYQLTHSEWLKTVKDLTGAEIKVLYYIRSLDPFGNCKHEYSVTQMASDLGLSKGAVSKALKKLEQVDEIDIELVRVKIQIKPSCNSDEPLPEENSVSYKKQEFPIGNLDLPEETSVSHRKHEFLVGNIQSPESPVDKDSSPSKIYIDFIKTLSEAERANFLNFCLEKTKNLQQEVNDIEAWLAHPNKAGQNRWSVYYEKFLASRQAEVKKVQMRVDTKNALDDFHRELEERTQRAKEDWERRQAQKVALSNQNSSTNKSEGEI